MFKIIEGTNKEVEDGLNALRTRYGAVKVVSMCLAENTLIVLVDTI